jgi:hypothetical protein
MKKFIPSELGNWLFKRQVEDDTLSQGMSQCSLDGSPTDLELRKASRPVGQISGSSRQRNQYMNPFDSKDFLSVMRKSSNGLVTFSDQICFECDEKGHYVNKCPKRRLKDQPTEMGITTLQTIQCSNSYKSQVIGNQNVLRSQATQNVTQTPPDRKYKNCEEKAHYFNEFPTPCIRRSSVLITNIAPTSSEKTTNVCFHCGQRCHFALHYLNRCQRQTPPDKKCYNCEEKGHFANVCPNPRSRPPLPPSTKIATNHKRGSTSIKATTSGFNYGKVGHLANRCPNLCQLSTPTQGNQNMARTLVYKMCYNCG